MDTDWIILAIAGGFTAFVLPWINLVRLNNLRAELDQLKTGGMYAPPVPLPAAAAAVAAPAAPAAPVIAPKPQKPSKPRRSFEEQFGQRLPVWIGAIALALGGYFLVRYSIENLLVTPLLRIVAGALLGVGLTYAADRLRETSYIANGARISQALSGAGIVVLYVTVTAATSLYGLLPETIGFLCLAGITALAVVSALRHGAPIALLGLTGGFLSPALIGASAPSIPLLFVYLYLLFAGLMLTVRRENWWWLSVPMLLGAFGWVIAWLAGGHFTPDESVFGGLFLLALSVTVASALPKPEGEAKPPLAQRLLRYAGLGGALLLSALTAGMGGFAPADWGMFFALSLGGMALAFFHPRQYGFLPMAAMGVHLLMLSLWDYATGTEFALVAFPFAALFSFGGYALLRRTPAPLPWALLSAISALAYFLLAYYCLHESVEVSMFWGMLAAGLAALATAAAAEIREDFTASAYQPRLLATYAAVATAFVALALGIELPREFLSVAIAAEMLTLAWIGHRLALPSLRPLVYALALVFGFLLLPQLLLLAQLTIYSLSEVELALQDTVPLVDWPAFQLGLPAFMFLATAWMLRQTCDGFGVRALEYAAIALIGVMGYYLQRHAFHVDENVLFVKAGFFERGTITNSLFIYALVCLISGRYWQRRAFTLGGAILCGAALFRLCYFDMLAYNPAFAPQEIGGVLLINALLLPFGLPLLWATLGSREMTQAGLNRSARFVSTLRLPLLFCLLSLNVRFLFHGGEAMHLGPTGNAEIYAYSFVWLLLGLGLLFAGTLRKDRLLRVASLVVMILTVSKVFLYDASELEGLYRVFSFLGLGASLLGLSWFYTRFVFAQREAESGGA